MKDDGGLVESVFQTVRPGLKYRTPLSHVLYLTSALPTRIAPSSPPPVILRFEDWDLVNGPLKASVFMGLA